MAEEEKRVYSPLDPPEKRPKRYAPLWITVILSLLLIFVSGFAFISFSRASKLEQDLTIALADLDQVQQKLETAEMKIDGSRYVIEKAQVCMDNLIDCFIGPSPGAFDNMKVVVCEEPLDKAMKKVYGNACDDLRDFANKFYADNYFPQEFDDNESFKDSVNGNIAIPSTPSAVTLPENGEILFNNANQNKTTAPFTIETKNDGYYYVKLKDSINGEDILGFFVYGGTEVNLEVPLGHYDLVYAYGHNWLGESDVFGEDTIYNKADETFLFYQDDGYVNGWTVELYLQSNGNLEIEEIPASEF